MVQQGPPPPRSGRLPASGRPRDWSNDDFADDDEEYPPWAGPRAVPRWADQDERDRRRLGDRQDRGTGDDAGHRGRSPGPPGGPGPAPRPARNARGRAAARSLRGRRTAYIWGGAFIAVLLVVAAVGYEFFHRPGPSPAPNSLVTTFQPGEFKTVQNACSAVTAATLDQYLPGKRRTVAPQSLYGSAQSLCDWTLDAKPMYRVLEVTVRAYAPSGLATGNGSATFAAQDAYQLAGFQLTHPSKTTHLPKASLTQLSGIGSSAFVALQVAPAGGDPTNLLTVVVRDHNVLVTVVSQGPAKPRHGYQTASALQLRAAALAAARDVIAGVH